MLRISFHRARRGQGAFGSSYAVLPGQRWTGRPRIRAGPENPTGAIVWHEIRFVADAGGPRREFFRRISSMGEHVGEVVRLISKPDLERARLIQEARAIYERIF